MAKISDKDWFKIQGWMVNQLGLTGSELVAFALVFNLSRTEEGLYKGGIMYLAKWLGCCRNTAIHTLQSLEEKGMIKAARGVGPSGSFCYYSAVQNLHPLHRAKSTLPPCNNCTTTVQNLHPFEREQTREQNAEHSIRKRNKKKIFRPTPKIVNEMREIYGKNHPNE